MSITENDLQKYLPDEFANEGFELKIVDILGRGSYGEVYVEKELNKKPILTKKMLSLFQTYKKNLINQIELEMGILYALKPWCAEYFTCYEKFIEYQYVDYEKDRFREGKRKKVSKYSFDIVMEYLENSVDLKKFLKHKITPILKLKFFIQSLKGLKILHSKNIAHRDIKLENFLAVKRNENHFLHYIDFGLSCVANVPNCYGGQGTLLYMYPIFLPKKKELITIEEAIRGDFWSLGLTLFLILLNKKNITYFFETRQIEDNYFLWMEQKEFDKVQEFWNIHLDKHIIRNQNNYILKELLTILKTDLLVLDKNININEIIEKVDNMFSQYTLDKKNAYKKLNNIKKSDLRQIVSKYGNFDNLSDEDIKKLLLRIILKKYY